VSLRSTSSTPRIALGGLLLLALLGLAEPALAQCAMCRSVLAQSPEGQAMATELNKAILLMFAGPYLVFGSLAAYIFRGPLRGFLRKTLGTIVLPR